MSQTQDDINNVLWEWQEAVPENAVPCSSLSPGAVPYQPSQEAVWGAAGYDLFHAGASLGQSLGQRELGEDSKQTLGTLVMLWNV